VSTDALCAHQRKEDVLRKARKQNGSLYLDMNGSGEQVWKFSWYQTLPNGRRARRKRQVGTLDEYKTEAAAERAVRGWRLAINSNEAHAFSGIKMEDVIAHFRMKELTWKRLMHAPGRPGIATRCTCEHGSNPCGVSGNLLRLRRLSSKSGSINFNGYQEEVLLCTTNSNMAHRSPLGPRRRSETS
jgi:hypothetical protein